MRTTIFTVFTRQAVAFGAVSALLISVATAHAETGMISAINTGVSTGVGINASSSMNSKGSDDAANTGINVNAHVMTDDSNKAASGSNAVDISAGGASTNTGSDASIESYAKAVMDSDSNVSNVQSNDTSVTLWYKVPGRFLGIIPTTVSAQVTANADGTSNIHYPWYDFLTVVNDANVKAEIGSQISNIIGGSASASAQLSDSTKTALINGIHSILEGWHSLTASTNASANASASASY